MTARLQTLGAEVAFLVRDRAKALSKLAHTGLACLSIPDVFHLRHDLAQGASRAIFRRLRQAQQALTQAQERLARAEASHPGGVTVPQAQGVVATHQAEAARWQAVRSAYRAHLAQLSLLLPPWRLVDSTRQTSAAVACRLTVEVHARATLRATPGFPAKDDPLTTVRTQLAGLAALVDWWWQTVAHALEDMVLTSSWKDWGDACLRPLMSWHEPRSRTRCPGPKAQIALALQVSQEAFERHPCPGRCRPEGLADWKQWAADQAKACQRASAAVEGCNGSLSQMQHHHRGLPTCRYPVWTAVHNCDGRAADSSTPASRFFR